VDHRLLGRDLAPRKALPAPTKTKRRGPVRGAKTPAAKSGKKK
jgi:hypothetical protein